MEKTRNLFNTKKVTLLSRSEKQDYAVYMEAITEDVEHSLDKMMNIHGSFTFVNKNGYKILSSAVYLYGEVDLTNKKDVQYLERYRKAILNPYDIGNWYYTSFNYETGTITYNEDRQAFLGVNSVSDFLKWFKFHYCMIGKPNRIIIYKLPIVRRLD